MTQIFKGWTVGLTDSEGRKYFLGIHKTAEGTRYGTVHDTPLEKGVYDNLFESEENALEFWKTCYWEYLENKSSLAGLPVKIKISVDVSAPGFNRIGVSEKETSGMLSELVDVIGSEVTKS